MTVIEQQYMDSVININRMMCKMQNAEPDWEQRRYEISKEVMASIVGAVVNGAVNKGAMYDPSYTLLAKTSIAAATALIEELKKTRK